MRCPHCCSSSKLLFKAGDRNFRTTREKFPYFKCSSCKLVYLGTRLADLSCYYPESYYPFPKSKVDLVAISKNESFKLELVQRYITKGKLLEIGPGIGHFAYLAKESGYDVQVFDVDAKTCKFLTEELEIQAFCGTDFSKSIAKEPVFNVIALWHVLEHMPNPIEFVEELVERLAPNGMLFISLPNPDAFQFKIFGRFWVHVDAPRHLHLIPQEILIEKLEKCGMSLRLKTSKDHGSLSCNYYGWNRTLAYWFPKQIARYMASVFYRLLYPLETKDRFSSAYTLVFQKEGL
jgi:2-polyprenyl-3-methyl-5-hydroxy-6-metoxy-1,4-benzoquinol methylase